MGEAVLHEVGVHGLIHGVLADDTLQRLEHFGGLAVGDSTIGEGAGIVVSLLGHGIEIVHAEKK